MDAKQIMELASTLPGVNNLRQQLTYDQASMLIDEFGSAAVIAQLEKMSNWRDLPKKNTSVYLTCKKSAKTLQKVLVR